MPSLSGAAFSEAMEAELGEQSPSGGGEGISDFKLQISDLQSGGSGLGVRGWEVVSGCVQALSRADASGW